MILKGQNFRVLTITGNKATCIGKSTNCTVTLTNNTSDASTKDDVGIASKPTVDSKSWSVSVESLNTVDAGRLLSMMKNMTPLTLMWDIVSESDNQSPEGADLCRMGSAFLSDVTFNWNDRENSTKSLQFVGSGPLEQVSSSLVPVVYEPTGNYTKGQFVRLFLSKTSTPDRVIAAAKNLSLHCSLTMENATSKDTPGDYQIQEPTALNYEITTSAMVYSAEPITSTVGAMRASDLEEIYEDGTPINFAIANVGGDNQRTKLLTIIKGQVTLTQLTVQGPNRQNATYEAQLSGYNMYETMSVQTNFPLPITQADLYEFDNPTLTFVDAVNVNLIADFLKITYESGSETHEAGMTTTGPEVIVDAGGDTMFSIAASGQSSSAVWNISPNTSGGPTWLNFSL